LAVELVVARKAGAALFRAAIGRAYYAAFHSASHLLGTLQFPPAENPQGHIQVVRLLQQSGDRARETAGGLLGDPHGDRILADYHLKRTDVETRKAAQAAVEIANLIIDELNTFAADQIRRTAVAATLKPLSKELTGK
jgi:uncharacterized protein (UPF0332 family)